MMEYLTTHELASTIWVGISFVIFVAGAWKLGGKAVLNALDSKIDEIRREIEEAENLRVEAQELLAQYQRKQRDAEKEAKTILENAQKSTDAIRAKAEKDLDETMARKEAQLAERLKRMEENAIAEIQNKAAELAVAATTQIIRDTLNDKIDASLVNETVSKLSANLN